MTHTDRQATTAPGNPLWQQPFHTPLEDRVFGEPKKRGRPMPDEVQINDAHAVIAHQHSTKFTPGALPTPSFCCMSCGEHYPLTHMRVIPNQVNFFAEDVIICSFCLKTMKAGGVLK